MSTVKNVISTLREANDKRKSALEQLGQWKYLILIALGIITALLGLAISKFLVLFIGIGIAALGLAMITKVAKVLEKVGMANSFKSYKINMSGVQDQSKKPDSTTGKNFIDAFINGARHKDQKNKFYCGISSSFRGQSPDKEQSDDKLKKLYSAFDAQGAEGLYYFFTQEINEYLEAKLAAENIDLVTGKPRSASSALINRFDDKKYPENKKSREIDSLAMKLANGVASYLKKSPDNRLMPEDFKLDDKGNELDPGIDVDKFFYKYIEEYARKESLSGKRGKLKPIIFGTLIGLSAGSILGLVQNNVEFMSTKFNAMAKIFGMSSYNSMIGTLVGGLLGAILLIVAASVYSRSEIKKVPERLKAETITQEDNRANSVTPTVNPTPR